MTRRTLEFAAPGAFVAYGKNARTHSEAQVGQIIASIAEFGFTNPVLVDEDMGVIAGHGRLLAAERMQLAEVPFLRLVGLTAAQKRALVLADNKLGLNSGWDLDLLKSELGDLRADGFDLGVIGFDTFELADIFATKKGKTEPDDAPPLEERAVTVEGDTWLLGAHRITCGDSTNADTVARALGGLKPHLMVTDPPYGVNYDPKWRARAGVNINTGKMGLVLNDDLADWREAWALFSGDVAYVWHAGLFAGVVADSLQACGFKLRSQIVWTKDRFALSRGDYHWQHEPCWYAVREGKNGHFEGGRSQSTRWDIKARDDSGVGHGTQKPVECMKRPIENNSKAGDAIYEPFSGSGTTIIAAEMTGRACHAIELNPAYADMAIMRWQEFTGEKAQLGKQTFAAVQAERAE